VSLPDPAFSGPRALKEEGSADWCWQTVDLLKRYLFNIEQTWRQADQVVSELEQVQAWKAIRPEKPYRSFNAMCLDLLGMPASDVRGRIDREKIKALRQPQGGRPRKGNLRDTEVIDHTDTADRVVARLKRDDPELADLVVKGAITPNAAAREKGWRKPRVVVSSPEAVARSLRKYMSADDIAALIAALTGKDRDGQT
jgi:hypothetical protein